MENKNKLKQIFITALEINESQFSEAIQYKQLAEWDSVAHMALVAEIEEQFDIMLDTDDIIDMSSFSKAIEILGKYDVEF